MPENNDTSINNQSSQFKSDVKSAAEFMKEIARDNESMFQNFFKSGKQLSSITGDMDNMSKKLIDRLNSSISSFSKNSISNLIDGIDKSTDEFKKLLGHSLDLQEGSSKSFRKQVIDSSIEATTLYQKGILNAAAAGTKDFNKGLVDELNKTITSTTRKLDIMESELKDNISDVISDISSIKVKWIDTAELEKMKKVSESILSIDSDIVKKNKENFDILEKMINQENQINQSKLELQTGKDILENLKKRHDSVKGIADYYNKISNSADRTPATWAKARRYKELLLNLQSRINEKEMSNSAISQKLDLSKKINEADAIKLQNGDKDLESLLKGKSVLEDMYKKHQQLSESVDFIDVSSLETAVKSKQLLSRLDNQILLEEQRKNEISDRILDNEFDMKNLSGEFLSAKKDENRQLKLNLREGEKNLSNLQKQKDAIRKIIDSQNELDVSKQYLEANMSTKKLAEAAEQLDSQLVSNLKKIAPIIEQTLAPLSKIESVLSKSNIGKTLLSAFNFDGIKKNFTDKVTNTLLKANGQSASIGSVLKTSFGEATSSFGKFIKSPLSLITMAIGFIQLLSDSLSQYQKDWRELMDATGLLKDEGEYLVKQSYNMADQYGKLGVNAEIAKKAAISMVDEFGSLRFGNTVDESYEFQANVAIAAKNLGLAVEDGAKLTRLMQSMGVSSPRIQKNLMLASSALAKAAGVPAGKVLSDMAKSSAIINTYFRGNLGNAIKTTVELHRLGLELKNIESISTSLLDWEGNIEASMEASVLMGRQVDMNRARLLLMQGDMEGMTKEVLSQVGSLEQFNKMNIIQKQALAKAAGLSVDELSKSLNEQAKLNKLTTKQRDEYDSIKKKIEAIRQDREKDIILNENQQLASEQYANVMTRLTQIWQNLVVSIAPPLLWIIEAIADTIDVIADGLSWITGGLINTTKYGENVLGTTESIASSVSDVAKSADTVKASFGGIVGKVATFGLGITLLFPIIRKMTSMFISSFKGIIDGFRGVGSVGKKIFNVLSGTTDKADKISGAGKNKTVGFTTFPKTMQNLGKGIRNLFDKVNFTDLAKFALFVGILLVSAYGLAKVAKEFDNVSWESMGKAAVGILGLVGITKLMTLLKKSDVLEFGLFMLALSGSIALLGMALKTFNDIEWESMAKAAVSIIGLTALVATLGAIMSSGVGAALIVLGTVALVAIAVGLAAVGGAMYIVSKATPGFNTFLDALIKLDPIKLIGVAAGITAVGASLVALTAGTTINAIGNFVSKLFGGGKSIFEQLEKLASISDKLSTSSVAIKKLTYELKGLSVIKSGEIDNIIDSLSDMSDLKVDVKFEGIASVNKLDTSNLKKTIDSIAESTNINPYGLKVSVDSLTKLASTYSDIDRLSNSIKVLTYEMKGLASVDYSKINQIADSTTKLKDLQLSSTSKVEEKKQIENNSNTTGTNSDDKVSKLLERIAFLLENQKTDIYMDSKKVGAAVKSNSRSNSTGGDIDRN